MKTLDIGKTMGSKATYERIAERTSVYRLDFVYGLYGNQKHTLNYGIEKGLGISNPKNSKKILWWNR